MITWTIKLTGKNKLEALEMCCFEKILKKNDSCGKVFNLEVIGR